MKNTNENKTILKELRESLSRQINDISKDFAGDYSLNSSSYICDAFTSYADSQIDIYYSDIFEWAKYNFDEVNEALSEFGSTGDIIKDIQQGQFLQYDRMLNQDAETILQLLIIDYLLNDEDITEMDADQLDRIFLAVDLDDTCQRLDDIKDTVCETLDEIREEEKTDSPDFKITLFESQSRYIIYKDNEYFHEVSKEANTIDKVILYIGELMGVKFENFFYNSANGQPVTVERMQNEEPDTVAIEGDQVYFIYGEE